MRKRPFSPARALRPGSALLLAASFALPALAQDAPPAPPAGAQTVSILQAQRAGDLKVVIRGTGTANHVRVKVTNTSARRLNVVVPPGLVAASSTAQGGGGFQSMGLGVSIDQLGRFGPAPGRDRAAASPGFRSIPATGAEPAAEGLGVAPEQTVEFDLTGVCLNFGIPTPERHDVFTLVDVDEYTPDARARKALRSLATLGTSQGVAQAVAWNVFNGMTYGQMASLAREYVNTSEISLAARFVEALDASGDHELVDPAYLQQGRVLVRVRGEGSTLGKVALGLASEMQGARIFGLPVQVVDEADARAARPASILLDVRLTGDADGRVRAKAAVRHNSAAGDWNNLGNVNLGAVAAGELNGERLAEALDRGVAQAFVRATPARRESGATALRVVNKLPLTVESLVLRDGDGDEAPRVTVDGLGVGPFRNGTATIGAASGAVERVVLNGL
jgi:hypothetical protein